MWVLTGAKRAGLSLDTARGTRIHGLRPDPFASLVNEADPEWSVTGVLQADRDGPDHLYQLSPSAIRRWRSAPERLNGELYRPETLKKVENELDALGPWEFDPPADLVVTEKVGIGDSLSKFAHRHYGDAELWPVIYEANRDRILDPNEIFPGLEVRIPRPQGD